jgi:hypothetical protein
MKVKVQRGGFCGECFWFLVFGYFVANNVRKLNILNSLNILNFLNLSDLSALVFKKTTYVFSGFLRNFCDFRGKQKNPRKSETIRVIRIPFCSASRVERGERGSPLPPHQTVRAVFPHTAFL